MCRRRFPGLPRDAVSPSRLARAAGLVLLAWIAVVQADVKRYALADEQAPADAPSDLRYRWEKGFYYAYRFTVEVELADAVQTVTGTCLYDVDSIGQPDYEIGFTASEEKGTGSAFVVAAHGYLLSCAHVVQNASEIDVALADKTYPGKVVAVDEDRDLALLSIAADDLPALPIGDSDAVELAQEVRAVGFPLSDVLGTSVKITRGTIAGIFTHENLKMFQVDAAINPGNSGGPLVNERGEVVGVTNAKVVGETVSAVGFAVPANQAKRLLSGNHVDFETAGAGRRLEGPELARRVTPAVALLTVTVGPGDAGESPAVTLGFRATTITRRRPKRAVRTGFGSLFDHPQHQSGHVTVNRLGEVLHTTGGPPLPGPLGSAELLIFDRLSPSGRRTWKTAHAVVLVRTEQESPSPSPLFGYGPPLSRYPPPSYLGRRGYFRRPGYGSRHPFSPPSRSQLTILPAVEQAEYELAESSEATVVIKKSYRFKTVGKAGELPMMSMVGQGKINFAEKVGVPKGMEFKATLSYNSGNTTLRVPIKVSYELTERQDKEAALAKSRESLEAARKAASTAKTPDGMARPPSTATRTPHHPPTEQPAEPFATGNREEKLHGFLEDLRSPEKNWTRRYLALSGLAMMEPIEARREEVAELLEPLLTDLNSSLRSSALRAVAKWGTKRNVPTLLTLLDEPDTSQRWPAMKALSMIGDSRAAERIAQLVPDSTDGLTAARALEAMGAVAEDAVIKLLDHDAYQVRSKACNILRVIGGKKSAEAITDLLNRDTDRASRAAAERALRDLKRRI